MYSKLRSRRSRILELLEVHRYLRRDMIEQQLFSGVKHPTRQCNALLLQMVKRKELKRFSEGVRTKYVYHIERRSQKYGHWLRINEFHFTLARRAKIIKYWLEYSYGYGVADGLYLVRFPSCGVKFFLEADDGHNQFDKLSKYQSYLNSRLWIEETWADPLNKGIPVFPKLVIVTPRKAEIDKMLNLKQYSYQTIVSNNAEEAVAKLLPLGVYPSPVR